MKSSVLAYGAECTEADQSLCTPHRCHKAQPLPWTSSRKNNSAKYKYWYHDSAKACFIADRFYALHVLLLHRKVQRVELHNQLCPVMCTISSARPIAEWYPQWSARYIIQRGGNSDRRWEYQVLHVRWKIGQRLCRNIKFPLSCTEHGEGKENTE